MTKIKDDTTINVARGTLSDMLNKVVGAQTQIQWILDRTSVGKPQLTDAHNDLDDTIGLLSDILKDGIDEG